MVDILETDLKNVFVLRLFKVTIIGEKGCSIDIQLSEIRYCSRTGLLSNLAAANHLQETGREILFDNT